MMVNLFFWGVGGGWGGAFLGWFVFVFYQSVSKHFPEESVDAIPFCRWNLVDKEGDVLYSSPSGRTGKGMKSSGHPSSQRL